MLMCTLEHTYNVISFSQHLIPFRRPEVLKITAKMGVGFDIYVWKPAYAANR